MASGKVISSVLPPPPPPGVPEVPQEDRRGRAGDLDVHLICDNYGTHKTPEIKKWLIRHPRFELHFTPTSSSWLNLVERWFGELTNRKLRRSAHTSVKELEADIRAWVDAWNDDRGRSCGPRPRTRSWRTSPDIFN